MIPQHIKDKVREEILAELEAYFEEAEEHEDDEVQEKTSVMDRCIDFYSYEFTAMSYDRANSKEQT